MRRGLVKRDAHRLTVSLRRLRASTVHALRGWSLPVTLLIVGGALVMLADGMVAAGGAVLLFSLAFGWCAGIWVIPWGEDQYARKFREIVRAGAEASQRDRHSYGDAARDSSESVSAVDSGASRRLTKLRPPPQWADRHARFMRAFVAYQQAMERYAEISSVGDVDSKTEALQTAVARKDELNRVTRQHLRELGECYVGGNLSL